jgi:predicted phage-related endonuclease
MSKDTPVKVERQLRVLDSSGELQGHIDLSTEYRILLDMCVASMKADLSSLETRIKEIDAELAAQLPKESTK